MFIQRAIRLGIFVFACGSGIQAQSTAISPRTSFQSGPFPSGFLFVDEETPAGAIDGVNTVFALKQMPNSPASVAVYRNGVRLRRNMDYTVKGTQISINAADVPQQGDVLMCSYRVGGGTTAAFAGADNATQGAWQGSYGADGYGIESDSTSFPTYAQVTVDPNVLSYTWEDSTPDARALALTSGADRSASTWFANSSFTIDINLTDGASHQVTLYCLDWDHLARAQKIDVVDAATNAVLSTQTLSDFSSGRYVAWNLTGHVLIRVTLTGGWNCVVSGIFFDS